MPMAGSSGSRHRPPARSCSTSTSRRSVQAWAARSNRGSDEVTITLHRPQHLHGTVTDAETGRPIERFVLISGWGPHARLAGRNGCKAPPGHSAAASYDLPERPLPRPGIVRSIRIEAEGYVPAEFLGFLDNVEDVAHDFKLRKAAPLTGIIRGPDGQSAGRRRCGPERVATTMPGSRTAGWANRTVREASAHEDRTGRPLYVPAAREARLDHRRPRRRVRDPLGRRTGRLDGHHPGALGPDRGRHEDRHQAGARAEGGRLAAQRGFSGRVDYDAQTDESGRFVLERVTPGRMDVYRYVEDADHRGWTASNPVSVDVKPGETVRAPGRRHGPAGRRPARHAGGVALATSSSATAAPATERPEPATPVDFLDLDERATSGLVGCFLPDPRGPRLFRESRAVVCRRPPPRRHVPGRGRPRRAIRPEAAV